MLLADVFETLRNTCLKHFKLDPAYFYTQSVLPWQAALKINRRKSWAAKRLRHDVHVSKIYPRSNKTNSALIYQDQKQVYRRTLQSNDRKQFFEHLDAKKLYGWAMSLVLSINSFKWISNIEKIMAKKITKLVKKSTAT